MEGTIIFSFQGSRRGSNCSLAGLAHSGPMATAWMIVIGAGSTDSSPAFSVAASLNRSRLFTSGSVLETPSAAMCTLCIEIHLELLLFYVFHLINCSMQRFLKDNLHNI